MRETEYPETHYTTTRSNRPNIERPPRRNEARRRLGISIAVVVVLINIVAWTVVAQKLRPPQTSLGTSSSATATLTPASGMATPTPARPTPTITPASTANDKTLYTYQCQMDGIHGLAWSADGKRIASTCMNVQAWDATTGSHVVTYENQSAGSTLSVAWSPDDKRIMASAQTAQIWDVATGNLLVTYQPKAATASSPQQAPSARSAGSNALASFVPLSGGNMIYDSTWSPDGTLVASAIDGNAYGYDVQVWNAQSGQYLFTLQNKASANASDYIEEVRWSPDGKYIAFTVDGTVQLWSVATKQRVLTHAGGGFAWSPDGKRIASGGTDIQVWDATTGKHVYIYKGHENTQYTSISIIKWSPDGTMIASGSSREALGGIVKVWIAA